MDESRRSFFEEVIALGALAGLLAEEAPAQVAAAAPGIRTSDFWGSFYEVVDPKKGKGNHQNSQLAAESKDIRFLYCDNNGKGLRYCDQLNSQDLLDHQGDVAVDFVLGAFRPGAADASSIRTYTSSQLRVDCVQTRPFMNLLAPAAWVAMASLYTNDAGKLPSLQTLGFQQPNLMSGQNKVILPGGSGKFAVNVSSMTKESILHKVLRNGVKIGGIVSPLIGLPAMSVPAATAFTAIYSLLEERASFIMSSPLIDAVATRDAFADGTRSPIYLPLRSGQYVAVPHVHTDQLAPVLSRLELNQGFLIDQSLPTSDPIDKRADNSAPDVTYLSLRVTVTPVNTGSGSAPASNPAAADTGSAPKPAASKKSK